MKLFVVYKKQTGEIVRTGSCSDRDFGAQVKDKATERIIQGQADKSQHKVVGGKVVEKSPEDMPPPRAFSHVLPAHRRAIITVEQWDDLLQRVTALETQQ